MLMFRRASFSTFKKRAMRYKLSDISCVVELPYCCSHNHILNDNAHTKLFVAVNRFDNRSCPLYCIVLHNVAVVYMENVHNLLTEVCLRSSLGTV